jgi:uncharacterized Zn finger protein
MDEDQIYCPTCEEDTEHSIIKSGQEILVRCANCKTAHAIQMERERLVNVKVIVNRDGTSQPYATNLPADEELIVGGELLVDDPNKEVVLTEIASLETDRRVERATARQVKTVWARAIDDVTLKISVYKNGITRSFEIHVPGNDVFEQGQVMKIEDIRFQIIKIKLRKVGFADMADAKDILRVWGREL